MKWIIIFTALLLTLSQAQNANDINWSELNATTLGNIHSVVFASINSSQLASIPSSAIPGFTQIGYISANASVGWSSLQVAELQAEACEGFTAAAFQAILPQTFAGFHNECCYDWNYRFGRYISPAQLSYLTPSAFAGLTIDVAIGLQTNCCAVISQAQFAAMAQFSPDNCYGIDSTCAPAIAPENFAGLTRLCTYWLPSGGWGKMNITQFSFVPPFQFQYLDDYNTNAINESLFLQFSIEQINYLSAEGIAGLSANKIANLTNKYGPTLFSLDKYVDYPLEDMVQFRNAVPNNVNYASIPAGTDWSTITWVQMALIPPGQTPVLNASFFASINDTTVGGIRPDQFSLIPLDTFQNFTVSQFSYLAPDLYAMSIDQLNALNPFVFASIPLSFLAEFNASLFPLIHPSQFTEYDPDTFSEMDCDLLALFTPDQIFRLNYNQRDAYLAQQYECQRQPSPTPTPTVIPTNTPTSNPTFNPTSSPSPTPSPSSSSTTGPHSITKDVLDKKAAFGFVSLGFFIGAIIVGAVAFVYIRKNKHKDYQTI